jgi:HEAT repeat protein
MTSTRGKRTAAWSIGIGLAVLAGTCVALREDLLDQLAIWRLEDEDEDVRRRAAARLGERRVARAVPALARVMGQHHRTAGVPLEADVVFDYLDRALVGIGLPAVPALVDLLRGPDGGLPERAADALLEIRMPPDIAIPVLLEVLERSRLVSTRCDAAGLLGDLAEQARSAAPELVESLGRFQEEDWNCAVKALLRIDPRSPDTIAALIRGLESANRNHRRVAAVHLGEMGPAARSAIPALLAAVEDGSSTVYTEALWALPRVGCEAGLLLPRLSEILRSEDPDRQWAAVEAAGDLAREDEDAVPILVEALKWGNAPRPILDAAVAALVEIGPAAIPALVDALGGDDPVLRICAARALAAFGPEARAAVPALIETLSGRDPELRLETMRTLRAIGPAAIAAVPALLERLEREEGSHRRMVAANALVAIGSSDPRLVEFLCEGLSDELDDVRAEAGLGCARLGEACRAAAPSLRTALEDGNLFVRTFAAWALERLEPGSARDLPAFTEAIEDDATREVAAGALAELPDLARLFLPQLVAILEEDDLSAGIRIAAAGAIGRLGPGAAAAAPALARCIASTNPGDPPHADNRRTLRDVFQKALESIRGRP